MRTQTEDKHRGTPGPVKANKARQLIALLACCLLLTACPPGGGDLLPSALDGAAIESRNFPQDTQSVTHEQVTIKARGNWSAADSHTSLILEVGNARADAVTVRFDSCEMINQESRESLSLRAMAEDQGSVDQIFLTDRAVTIAGGQVKKYYASFFIREAEGRSSVTRDMLGQSVSLRVPVRIGVESPAPVDFLFNFKYVEYQH
jgi:hypothetical protein